MARASTRAARPERVAADGSKTATSYTTNYDGKDVPLTGSATTDTVSLKRINATTVERTDKKAGTPRGFHTLGRAEPSAHASAGFRTPPSA